MHIFCYSCKIKKLIDCLEKKILVYLAFIDQNIFAMSSDYVKLMFTHILGKRYPKPILNKNTLNNFRGRGVQGGKITDENLGNNHEK